MQRLHQIVFAVSLVALSWFAMMALHEFGHVFGAILTGGNVERVVLHPLTISRTDVSPNPHPLMVVWMGPMMGCLLPIVIWALVPRGWSSTRNVAFFFVGFCLIANGAYIGLGSFDRVGDGGVMLQYGSPLWLLLFFGSVTFLAGLFIWHRLGSIKQFLSNPSDVEPVSACVLFGSLCTMLILEFVLSPI